MSNGDVLWTLSGDDDGPCGWPLSVARGPGDEFFLLDAPEDFRVQRFDLDGRSLGGVVEIPAEDQDVGLEDPQDFCIGPDGRLYIADAGADRIGVWSTDGRFLQWIGSSGERAGQFQHPVSVAIDADGFLYVADAFNRRVQKLSADGLVGFCTSEQDETLAFEDPSAIAIGADGLLFVGDAGPSIVRVLATDGRPLEQQPLNKTPLDGLADVHIDAAGGFCISDKHNTRVRRYTADGEAIGEIDLGVDDPIGGDVGDMAVIGDVCVLVDRTGNRLIGARFGDAS